MVEDAGDELPRGWVEAAEERNKKKDAAKSNSKNAKEIKW